MSWRGAALLLPIALAACARQSAPSPVSPPPALSEEQRRAIQAASLQVLFWSDAERLARFREMERHSPGSTAAPARRPRLLPAGRPVAGLSAIEVADFMASQRLVGLMVVQDGRIRLERYAQGFGPGQRWTSFSVAKSLTSTLAGQALKEGHIRSLADPVTRYVPELAGSAYDGVTVEQVLSMTSGVRWNENYADPASDVARMYSEQLRPGADPLLTYLARLPREAEPGTRFVYKTGETNLAGTIVQRATGKRLTDYAAGKLVQAAGFEGELFWLVDPSGQDIGGCCLSLTLRDYARLGLLALEGGRGVTAPGWFARASRPYRTPGPNGVGYGFQWWTYPGGAWGAQGIFGQAITILPQERAVVVQLGNWPRASDPDLRRQSAAFARRVGDLLDQRIER